MWSNGVLSQNPQDSVEILQRFFASGYAGMTLQMQTLPEGLGSRQVVYLPFDN